MPKTDVRFLVGAIVVGAGVLALLVHLTRAEPSSGRRMARERAEARLAAVRAAAAVPLDGAASLATSHPSEIPAARHAQGDRVTYVTVLRTRRDVAGVRVEEARTAPVEALLALARAQERPLLAAGFQAMAAEWTTEGDVSRQPVASPRSKVDVLVMHHTSTGGGGGPSRVDLDAPVIVHFRVYTVPASGATLVVRNRYDRAARVVDSELSYADRTVEGADYLIDTYRVTEELGRPE
jgi:hypothetical protein